MKKLKKNYHGIMLYLLVIILYTLPIYSSQSETIIKDLSPKLQTKVDEIINTDLKNLNSRLGHLSNEEIETITQEYSKLKSAKEARILKIVQEYYKRSAHHYAQQKVIFLYIALISLFSAFLLLILLIHKKQKQVQEQLDSMQSHKSN